MKAKKEFFLKFLKDDDYPIKKKSKLILENGSSTNNQNNNNIEINNGNKNKINFPKLKSKKDNYSFEKFTSEIKDYDYSKKTKWDNEARKYSINLDKKANIIKLTEMTQINFKNPLSLLNKEYMQENYNPKLLEKELMNIESQLNKNKKENNIYNDNIFIEKLMEEREKFELYKKILKYYLDYYCINNKEIMNPPMDKIRQLTKITDFYYDKLHSKKKEILILKKCNIDNGMKLILKKKKLENLIKIYSLLKNNISLLLSGLKELKANKLNYNFISYYQKMNKMIEEVEKIDKIIINKLNIRNNGIEKNIKKFNAMKYIKEKLISKKAKFNQKINEEINNIFDSKKSYIFHLFYLSDTINNHEKSKITDNKDLSFVDKMNHIFKKKSKKIILESLQIIHNTQNKGKIFKLIHNINNPKLSNMNNIALKENFLIIYFINILSKLKNLLDIFLYYYNSIIMNNIKEKEYLNKYENLKNDIKSSKNEFYEILDKHLSKTIILIENSTIIDDEDEPISKKNLFYILNLICLFVKLLKIKFNVKYNKFTNIAIKNYLMNKFKSESRKCLEKSIILLSDDIWEKNTLDKSVFQFNSIKLKIPTYLKRFISFFNESEIKDSWISKIITKDNIDDIFNCIINNDDYNINDIMIKNKDFDKIIFLYIKNTDKENYTKELEKENNIIIFNEPINYEKLYIINSSLVIVKGIEEQIINILIFESLVFDIFNNLFETIDLYIFIIFKIFVKDSRYKSELLLNLTENDIEKDSGDINYLCNIIYFQKKFLDLKKFYNSSKILINNFFGQEIKINIEEENNFYENLISYFNIGINNKENKTENGIISEKNLELRKEEINLDNNEKNNNNKNNLEQEDDIEILNINEMNYSTENNNKVNESNKFFSFFSNIDNKNNKITEKDKSNEEIINETKIIISKIDIKKIIVLISSIQTIKKILKRLISFSTKVELELERYEILSKINKYENLLEQMRNFFYLEISSYIFDFSLISNLILNYNWSPTPNEGSKKLFDASDWVKRLKILFDIIVSEIHNKLGEQFGEKKLSEFLNVLIKHIINCIQESFSQIKKCNDMGRSIMLKDIKQLKEGIEKSLKKYGLNKKIKIEKIFDSILQYVNAWYYNSDELYQYIFNYNIEYKYFENIFYSSPIIAQLAFDAKNDFFKKVKQNYLNKFKKFIVSIKKDN